MNAETFLQGYIICALWSSTGPSEAPYQCEMLDDIFTVSDISPECVEQRRSDCSSFLAANGADLAEYAEHLGNEQWSASSLAGHDFWLTRNGRGAGFWDRGLGELGERLSNAARVYSSVDLYPGDDGKIYGA